MLVSRIDTALGKRDGPGHSSRLQRASRASSLRRPQQLPLLLLLALLYSATFSSSPLRSWHVLAYPPSRDLLLARGGRTYEYTMQAGLADADSSLLPDGASLYPHVFSKEMNELVVSFLTGYLSSSGTTLEQVGGGFDTCMRPTLYRDADVTGIECFKTLLAVAAPVDCPAPNILCCPLYWSFPNEGDDTTLANMKPETIFWDGSAALNGFFANFSTAYLKAHSNCSEQLFSTTTHSDLRVGVDAYGEWRFVNSFTDYTLLETELNSTEVDVSAYVGNDPQKEIQLQVGRQQNTFTAVTLPMAIGANGALLGLLFFLLLLLLPLCIGRPAQLVRHYQRSIVEHFADWQENPTRPKQRDTSRRERGHRR